MHKHNAVNERIKREYFTYLKEARRQSEASVDAVAAALARFEAYTRCRDFKTFHHQQAVAFKQWLSNRRNETTGKPLSKATLHATLCTCSNRLAVPMVVSVLGNSGSSWPQRTRRLDLPSCRSSSSACWRTSKTKGR